MCSGSTPTATASAANSTLRLVDTGRTRLAEALGVPVVPAVGALRSSIAAVLFPIETERLLLRPYEPRDIDDFVRVQTHPDVSRYLYWGGRSRAELEQVLAEKIERMALARRGDAVDLAVIVRE